MNGLIGWARGFFIALAIPIGLPLATILLAFAIPAVAMVFAYLIAPQLAFLYPAFLFPDIQSRAAILSLVQALVFAAAIGWVLRYRSGGAQFGWASLVLAAWWVVWRLAGLAFGLHPNFVVRM